MPEKFPSEFLKQASEMLTIRQIIDLWSSGADERFITDVHHYLRGFKDDRISIEAATLGLSISSNIRHDNLPFEDPLTGSYSRKELYDVLSICHELGHSKAILTVMDMNFLKEYNNLLGEPEGGNYALAFFSSIAKQIVEENEGILIRYQGSGGDDFIAINFPSEDKEPTNLGKKIQERLSQFSPEDFFSGQVNGHPVRYDGTRKVIALDKDAVSAMKTQKGEVVSIIAPPSFTYHEIEVDPTSDITAKQSASGETYYETQIVAHKIEDAMQAIKIKKNTYLRELETNNSIGASHLSRRSV